MPIRPGFAAMAGVCAGVLGTAVILTQAGPLSPPGGPVSSTYKTLVEVEPRVAISSTNTPGDAGSVFKITQPGSYYLTGNVAGVNGKHGILVVADNVTIDLAGFALIGTATALDAVHDDGGGAHRALSVRNGTISGWGQGSGVYAAAVSQVIAQDLTVSGNLFEGVWAGPRSVVAGCVIAGARNGIRVGPTSGVRSCSTMATTEHGIDAGAGAALSGCTVTGSSLSGINAGDGSTLEGCAVSAASGVGAAGFTLGNGCTADRCSALSNAAAGIVAGESAVLRGCVARGNALDNILVGLNSVVEACTAANSTGGHGISCSASVVSGCSANGNNQNGIEATNRSTVRGCTANNNLNGIHATFAGEVRDCFADFNTGCGILADNGGHIMIIGNCCLENGTNTQGAGIRASVAPAVRIEDNTTNLNYRGIDVLSTRNIVSRNQALGNTNTDFSIVAGNAFGPLIIVAGAGDMSAVSGAGHPTANFRY